MHRGFRSALESAQFMVGRFTSPRLQRARMVITDIIRMRARPTATTDLSGSPAVFSWAPAHGSTATTAGADSMAAILIADVTGTATADSMAAIASMVAATLTVDSMAEADSTVEAGSMAAVAMVADTGKSQAGKLGTAGTVRCRPFSFEKDPPQKRMPTTRNAFVGASTACVIECKWSAYEIRSGAISGVELRR
jgi:hypothetical protein